ncbi:glyoxalase superfamily protein [Nocardioides zeae]|uniref:Bleomycin resistance protein n=1 Tax=Nocardioides imazamoxiresistens TaxID=3231893 RepID=A0ABU3Q1S4_9ACTN|nr:glyoxalase superfamily protein [Nocardioides zeae]MDT9594990.1 glyoxalase superfamily protein [Nocardioides zeae]
MSRPSLPSSLPLTVREVKDLARSLRGALAPHVRLAHGQALDVLARAAGLPDWNALAARYAGPGLGAPMPILRVYDSGLAHRFYVDWLGFDVDFVHRYDAAAPAFTGISRDQVALGLSEHHGDGTPGSVVWIPVRELAAYRAALLADPAAPLRPGIDRDAPGGPTMSVLDPFGNELRFCEPDL